MGQASPLAWLDQRKVLQKEQQHKAAEVGRGGGRGTLSEGGGGKSQYTRDQSGVAVSGAVESGGGME